MHACLSLYRMCRLSCLCELAHLSTYCCEIFFFFFFFTIPTGEWEDGQSHLKCTRQSLEELEHSKQLLNEELSHKQRALSQSEMECSKLRENVEKLRGLLEDQQEENTELISKITAQSAEVSTIKNANVELESRLAMSELLVQQVSEVDYVICKFNIAERSSLVYVVRFEKKGNFMH